LAIPVPLDIYLAHAILASVESGTASPTRRLPGGMLLFSAAVDRHTQKGPEDL
jgi:hypothetical protein